jgi:hypothetical protein
LPIENGYTHIAFFLRWCIEKDFLEPAEFSEQALAKIPLIKNGEFDCRQFLSDYLDGYLVSKVLNTAGQEFADNYYNSGEWDKRPLKHWTFFYLDDFHYYQKNKKMTYTKVNQKGAFYSVENTECNYQVMKKIIDRRYQIFLDMKNRKDPKFPKFFVGINWDFFKRKKK